MSITEVIPKITPHTVRPTRTDPSTFYDYREIWMGEEETITTEKNEVVDSTNIWSGQANQLATDVNADAVATENAKNIAVASANYKGDWVANFNGGVGYALNDGVTYTDGFNYVSKIDNNLVEPTAGTNTAEWNFIEQINPNNYYLKTETYSQSETDSLLDDKIDKDINSLTSKTTPVDNDELVLSDSEATFNLKKLSFSNLWNWIRGKVLTTFGVQFATAWVNFNGKSGSVSIRGAHNVSSVTRNATGDYTITFSTPMDNVNYSVVGTCQFEDDSQPTDISNALLIAPYEETPQLNYIRIHTGFPGQSQDQGYVSLQIFGGKN